MTKIVTLRWKKISLRPSKNIKTNDKIISKGDKDDENNDMDQHGRYNGYCYI
jgi:hypothetical protein